MKSMIYTGTAPKDTFCLVCTNRATKMVVLGKTYTHSIDVDQFFVCDECAEKVAKSITGKMTIDKEARGKWIHRKKRDYKGGGLTYCSKCRYAYADGAFFEVESFRYCPNCGSAMETNNE